MAKPSTNIASMPAGSDPSSSSVAFTPSIANALAAIERGEFYPWIDLEASRARVADFIRKYPEIAPAISAVRGQLAIDKEVEQYENPQDVIDFCIGQVLRLNKEETLLDGSRFCTRSLSNESLNSLIDKNSEALFLAIKKIHETNPQDRHVAIILAAMSDEEAQNLLEELADQEYAPAQYELGAFLVSKEGLEDDGLTLLDNAANNHHCAANYGLGICYKIGLGGFVNQEVAIRCFLQGAELEDASSQYELGACYYDGYGVEESVAEAVNLWNRAANQGDSNAQRALAVYYYTEKGDEQSLLEAAKLLKLAADQGNPAAQHDLANCLLDGSGVEKSATLAIWFLAKAASNGHAESLENLLACGASEISIDKAAANLPLGSGQIIDVINALSKDDEIASARIAQDDSDFIASLVEVSLDVLDLDELREIAKVLRVVPGINVEENRSLNEIYGFIAAREIAEPESKFFTPINPADSSVEEGSVIAQPRALMAEVAPPSAVKKPRLELNSSAAIGGGR